MVTITIKRTNALVAAVVCSLSLYGCSPSVPIAGTWEYREETRIKSPDSQVEAVLMTGSAGATTSTQTAVVIVSAGKRVPTNEKLDLDAVFKAARLKGLKVFWKEEHLLAIQYDQARIGIYRNDWQVLDDRTYSYPVEIRLEPTSPRFSLPPEDRQPIPVKFP